MTQISMPSASSVRVFALIAATLVVATGWSAGAMGQVAPGAGHTRVICTKIGSDDEAAYRKPRSCKFYVANGSSARVSAAGEVVVIKMRWKRWGGKRAVARGTFAGNMDYRKRGRVILSRLRNCPALDVKLYTRFKFKSGGTVFDFRLSECA